MGKKRPARVPTALAPGFFEGVYLNSRDPDPQRVRTVGSGAHWPTPFPGNPGETSKTSIFNNPSGDSEIYLGKHVTQNDPKARNVASRRDETPTCSERIVPGIGPNYFLGPDFNF